MTLRASHAVKIFKVNHIDFDKSEARMEIILLHIHTNVKGILAVPFLKLMSALKETCATGYQL